MHALKATEKGKHGKSVKAYAEVVGRPERSVSREVAAARVAQSSPRLANLADKSPSPRRAAWRRALALARAGRRPSRPWLERRSGAEDGWQPEGCARAAGVVAP